MICPNTAPALIDRGPPLRQQGNVRKTVAAPLQPEFFKLANAPRTAGASHNAPMKAAASNDLSEEPYLDSDDDGILPTFAGEGLEGYKSDEFNVFMVEMEEDSQPDTFKTKVLPSNDIETYRAITTNEVQKNELIEKNIRPFGLAIEGKLGKLVAHRCIKPSQIFHLSSFLFTNDYDPFVVFLALDEASQMISFSIARCSSFTITTNQSSGYYRMDAVSEERAVLALLDDISSKRSPSQLVHSDSSVLLKPRIRKYLADRKVKVTKSSTHHKAAMKVTNTIFELIKLRHLHSPDSEDLINLVKMIVASYHSLPQYLILSKPQEIFNDNRGLITNNLNNLVLDREHRHSKSDGFSTSNDRNGLFPARSDNNPSGFLGPSQSYDETSSTTGTDPVTPQQPQKEVTEHTKDTNGWDLFDHEKILTFLTDAIQEISPLDRIAEPMETTSPNSSDSLISYGAKGLDPLTRHGCKPEMTVTTFVHDDAVSRPERLDTPPFFNENSFFKATLSSSYSEQKDDPSGLKRGENQDTRRELVPNQKEMSLSSSARLPGPINPVPISYNNDIIRMKTPQNAELPARQADVRLALVTERANLSVKFAVRNQVLSGILDSGANVNMMPYKTAEKLRLIPYPLVYELTQLIGSVAIRHAVKAKVKIGKFTKYVKFLLYDHPSTVILGLDIMLKFHLRMDYFELEQFDPSTAEWCTLQLFAQLTRRTELRETDFFHERRETTAEAKEEAHDADTDLCPDKEAPAKSANSGLCADRKGKAESFHVSQLKVSKETGKRRCMASALLAVINFLTLLMPIAAQPAAATSNAPAPGLPTAATSNAPAPGLPAASTSNAPARVHDPTARANNLPAPTPTLTNASTSNILDSAANDLPAKFDDSESSAVANQTRPRILVRPLPVRVAHVFMLEGKMTKHEATNSTLQNQSTPKQDTETHENKSDSVTSATTTFRSERADPDKNAKLKRKLPTTAESKANQIAQPKIFHKPHQDIAQSTRLSFRSTVEDFAEYPMEVVHLSLYEITDGTQRTALCLAIDEYSRHVWWNLSQPEEEGQNASRPNAPGRHQTLTLPDEISTLSSFEIAARELALELCQNAQGPPKTLITNLIPVLRGEFLNLLQTKWNVKVKTNSVNENLVHLLFVELSRRTKFRHYCLREDLPTAVRSIVSSHNLQPQYLIKSTPNDLFAQQSVPRLAVEKKTIYKIPKLPRQTDRPETQPKNPPKAKEDCPRRFIANTKQKESPSKGKCQNADLITNARVSPNHLGEKEFTRNHKNLMNHTPKEPQKVNH